MTQTTAKEESDFPENQVWSASVTQSWVRARRVVRSLRTQLRLCSVRQEHPQHKCQRKTVCDDGLGELTLRSAPSPAYSPKTATFRARADLRAPARGAGSLGASSRRLSWCWRPLGPLNVWVLAQEGAHFVAVTLPEGSRFCAPAPLSLFAPRPRQPLQREARLVFAPQERTRGASPALCFSGGLEDQSWRGALVNGPRSRELRLLNFGEGWFLPELVKASSPPRHLQLVLVSSQSCVCGSNVKVFPSFPEKSLGSIHPRPSRGRGQACLLRGEWIVGRSVWRRRRRPERSARAGERSCCRAPRSPLAGRKSCEKRWAGAGIFWDAGAWKLDLIPFFSCGN